MAPIVSALKQAEGLPTADVKPITPAPSAVVGARSNQPNDTPVQQQLQAQQIMQDIQSRQSQPVQQTEAERALAAKDKAIADLKAEKENLQLSNQSSLEKIEQLLTQLTTPKAPDQPVIPDLPGLPDDINDRPADEQLKAVMGAYTDLKNRLGQELSNRDKQIIATFTPLVKEVQVMAAEKDKRQVLDAHPNFDYDKYLPEINQMRAELAGATALEAARLVALKHDDQAALSRSEPQVPVTEASIPSMQTASGMQPGVQDPRSDDSAQIVGQLRDAIGQANFRGNTAASSQLMEQLLKVKLIGKGR
jgi:hypothetical protein